MRTIPSLRTGSPVGWRRLAAATLASLLLLPLALPAQAAEPAPEGDRAADTLVVSTAGTLGSAATTLGSVVDAVSSGGHAAASSGVATDELLPPPSTSTVATVRADEAWQRGVTGAGVGVALIDTGVSASVDLPLGSPPQVRLAGPGRADGDGHGTFMAGLIVGGDGPDQPVGVAPDAPLWSLKVAADDGATSLEQVLTGLELVRRNADELGVRVVVLALGGPVGEQSDALEAALEQLWAEGLVVVVGSGNDGSLTAPGVSPYLITVGAVDDRGGADDGPAHVDWSGSGVGRDGRAKPDLLAPGASVVSYRSPGSVADRDNPASRIQERFFRGTGTSMSAATTAGAAALLLEANPELTPDEVKGRLVAAARPIAGQGAGVLDVMAALDTAAPAANAHLPRLDAGAGPLGDQLGEWIGRSWIGRSWIDQEWVGRSWVGRSWIGRSWIGRSWIGRSWIGRSWIGRSWIDQEWVGRSWIGRSWIGRSWI